MESVTYEMLSNNLNGPITTLNENLNTQQQCNQFNVAVGLISFVLAIEMLFLLYFWIKQNLKPISTRNLIARLNN